MFGNAVTADAGQEWKTTVCLLCFCQDNLFKFRSVPKKKGYNPSIAVGFQPDFRFPFEN